jgi:osmoprotectant transport system permease protein
MNQNLQEQLILLPDYFQGHLALTLIALSLGIAISVPLGVWASHSRLVRRPLLLTVSILQTIPSIAILALMVALLGGRIGLLPAIIALVLYCMLPIVRNTVTGLENVSEEVVEAARGIGMSARQILLRVRLPLALPVIIAGIRTAAVWTVGLATLSTLVGATSFGNYIFTGLQTRNLLAVTVGSVAAALMAVVLDSIIAGIEWLAEHRNDAERGSRFRLVRNSVVAAVVLCGGFSVLALLPKPEADYVVGGKAFTEQYILAELLTAELEEAGYRVDQRFGLGTEVIYEATANNNVDVYVEYSGTVWANIMDQDHNPGRSEVLSRTQDFMQTEHQIHSIGPLGFQNLYTFAMTRTRAEELGVDSIEDLIPIADSLVAGGDLEFFGRPEWMAVRDTYNIDFGSKLTFDTALMYTAVAEGQVDLITAYSSDGRIAAYDLLVLEDPRSALLPYDAILITSPRAAGDSQLLDSLAYLRGQINDSLMQQANRIVDVDGGSVSEAVSYLQQALSTAN